MNKSTIRTSHIDIAVESISCFANDGTLDSGEVRRLVSLAMRDGVMDDDEKRVLKNIFSKVSDSELSHETIALIKDVKAKYSF